jgi:hypothetical protein
VSSAVEVTGPEQGICAKIVVVVGVVVVVVVVVVELGGIEPLRERVRRPWSRAIVPGQDAFSSVLR